VRAANAAPAGRPESSRARPHTAARALLTISAPGCAGTMPATSVIPASAARRSSASDSAPTSSQPVRGAPTPVHDSVTVDGGTGSSTSSSPALARRSSTADSGTVTSIAEGSARPIVRSPRMVGVDSPNRRGRSTHTYAARTEPAACRRMAPSSTVLARLAKVRRSARSRGSANRKDSVSRSDTKRTLPAEPWLSSVGAASKVEP